MNLKEKKAHFLIPNIEIPPVRKSGMGVLLSFIHWVILLGRYAYIPYCATRGGNY